MTSCLGRSLCRSKLNMYKDALNTVLPDIQDLISIHRTMLSEGSGRWGIVWLPVQLTTPLQSCKHTFCVRCIASFGCICTSRQQGQVASASVAEVAQCLVHMHHRGDASLAALCSSRQLQFGVNAEPSNFGSVTCLGTRNFKLPRRLAPA